MAYKVIINNRNADKPKFFVLSDDEWNPDPEYCEPVDENIQSREEAEKIAAKYRKQAFDSAPPKSGNRNEELMELPDEIKKQFKEYGAQGGRNKAAKMTADQRKALSAKMNKARWKHKKVKTS